MADTGDIEDGKCFGLDTPCDKQGWFLSAIPNSSKGIKNRTCRNFPIVSGRRVMPAK